MMDIDGKTVIGGAALLGAAAAIDSARRVVNDIDEGRKQEQISGLIQDTNREIHITTDLDCFDNSCRILDALTSAAQRDVEITIKYDPRVSEDLEKPEYSGLRDLADESSNVTLVEANTELDRHYMVLDDGYVRIDEHEPREFGESGSPGMILKGDAKKAEFVRNKIRNEV